MPEALTNAAGTILAVDTCGLLPCPGGTICAGGTICVDGIICVGGTIWVGGIICVSKTIWVGGFPALKLEFDNNRDMERRAEPERNADTISVVVNHISLLLFPSGRVLLIPFHGHCNKNPVGDC